MIFKHRQNDLTQPTEYGVEIDLRTTESGIILNHDIPDYSKANEYPFLEYSIDNFNGPIIFNIKESGIEELILKDESLQDKEYYFLDSQIPDIIRLGPSNPGKFIIRVSDMEHINHRLFYYAKPKYAWLDYSFRDKDFNVYVYLRFVETMTKLLSELGVEPILVSPELYDINNIKLAELLSEKIKIDSVCTKFPEIWEK